MHTVMTRSSDGSKECSSRLSDQHDESHVIGCEVLSTCGASIARTAAMAGLPSRLANHDVGMLPDLASVQPLRDRA